MRRAAKVIGKVVGVILVGFVVFAYLNNSSRRAELRTGLPTVLSHRGVSQQFEGAGFSPGSCEAERIARPSHDYIENTIRSMEAAFGRGADVVEFDAQLTRDGQWAVFHDRRLECRTNGTGLVAEHTLEELQALDVAYGYTADGGKTYPFRGIGVGQMPSMDEVFESFPAKSFLIDIKANDTGDGVRLARRLAQLPSERRNTLTIFGREEVLVRFRADLPEIPAFSLQSIQACLVPYIAYGWTGIVPRACHDAPVYVPINVAPFLWGWPNLFMDRLEAGGSTIVTVGPFPGGISPGVDTLEDLSRLPDDYNGGIWTNDVRLVRDSIESVQ